jgi:hypothetical protein
VHWAAIVGTPKFKEVGRAAVTHLLLRTVGDAVFGSFRKQYLCVSSVRATDSVDDSLLCCELKVEQARAEAWLKLLQSSADLPAAAGCVVQQLVGSVVTALGKAQGVSMCNWNLASNEQALELLQPLIQPLVLKAMLAQATAAVMHSRLLQLVVPGWLSSSTVALSDGAVAPEAWGQCPGVVVFDRAVMERGAGVQASSGAPAAVFCQDVGVVLLAESVKDLPEFRSAAGVEEGGAGPVAAAQVLKKPRVFVAAANN